MNSDLDVLSAGELLKLYADVLDQLKRKGVTRSLNNPVADYSEWLTAQAFGLTLQPKSQAGFDATDSEGIRYQIKGRRLTPSNSSRQLSPIRNLDKIGFNYLIGILFRSDFTVLEGYKIPQHVVAGYARFSRHVNGHILLLKGPILSTPGVERVDEQLIAHALNK